MSSSLTFVPRKVARGGKAGQARRLGIDASARPLLASTRPIASHSRSYPEDLLLEATIALSEVESRRLHALIETSDGSVAATSQSGDAGTKKTRVTAQISDGKQDAAGTSGRPGLEQQALTRAASSTNATTSSQCTRCCVNTAAHRYVDGLVRRKLERKASHCVEYVQLRRLVVAEDVIGASTEGFEGRSHNDALASSCSAVQHRDRHPECLQLQCIVRVRTAQAREDLLAHFCNRPSACRAPKSKATTRDDDDVEDRSEHIPEAAAASAGTNTTEHAVTSQQQLLPDPSSPPIKTPKASTQSSPPAAAATPPTIQLRRPSKGEEAAHWRTVPERVRNRARRRATVVPANG